MKSRKLRYIAAVLVCTLLLSLLPAHAMAQRDDTDADTGTDIEVYVLEETEESEETGKTGEEQAGGLIVADFAEDMPDNDELFAGYVQQVFYPELATATYANYAKRCLSDAEYAVYKALKTTMGEIATGERASTIIRLQTNLTGEEIDQLDVNLIYYCLLYDCPYEMYWHNKILGGTAETNEDLGTVVYSLVVDPTYAADGYRYRTDTTKAERTVTAKENADQIVQKYAALSDKEKLKAYKDEICALTSYNDEAAETVGSNDTTYGDPWQIIYVFDGDTSTNVVCEGYAKAFQYLCDQSEFTGDVRCYTVDGTMTSATMGGAHMWNIVTLEGTNYLVDVTNSDEGTAGQNGGLFLVTGRGSAQRGYTFYPDGKWVRYVYSDETLAVYDDASVLTLGKTLSNTESDADEDDGDDSIEVTVLEPTTEDEQEQNEQPAPDPAPDEEEGDAATDKTILLVCGVGVVGLSAAAVVYFFYYRPVSLAGVAYAANGEVLPYATVRLLRGGRVLATAQADANGAYSISARGANTLEVSYTDPETGEEVTTRQSLKNGLGNGLENGLESKSENANTPARGETESLREAA